MIITTDNYEEYFYRYCEGGLTADESAAVEAFAAQHPDLAEELSLYDPTLKLAEEPMPYPDKEGLMRHEPKVLPLWRWAAAACVAAVLVGCVWLLWPDGSVPEQPGVVAQVQRSAYEVKPAEPAPQLPEVPPAIVAEPANAATPSASPAAPVKDEPITALPQYEPPAMEEPALLAEAEPPTVPQQEDTMVIEYIDIMLMPTPMEQVEVVQIAYQPTVRERFRAFRSRVSNTVRDYAYQSYAETRGEIRTRINY